MDDPSRGSHLVCPSVVASKTKSGERALWRASTRGTRLLSKNLRSQLICFVREGYWRVIVIVPSATRGSHESLPLYSPDRLLPATPDAETSITTRHVGVG